MDLAASKDIINKWSLVFLRRYTIGTRAGECKTILKRKRGIKGRNRIKGIKEFDWMV